MNLLLLSPNERLLPSRDPRARHILKVLKLGRGDSLKAGVVGGPIGEARVQAVTESGVELLFTARHDPEPLPDVSILLGHPRPIVLRRIFRDLTAIGVGRLVVVHTDLGERSYLKATLWDDLETALLEGASQGGTTLLPEVTRHHRLSDAIGHLGRPSGIRIVLHPADGDHPGTSLLERLIAAAPGAIAVAIGSERGWTDSEMTAFQDAGFVRADMGSRILRTETAAQVAAWAAVSRCRREG